MNAAIRECQTKKAYALSLLISVLLFIPNDGLCLGLFDVGVHFTGSSPQSEFKEIVDQNGYGVSATALFRMGLLPLKLGLEIGSYSYGEESESLPAGTGEIDSETKNFTGHVVLRLQQGVGDFAPYGDFLVGINAINTKTSVKTVLGSFSEDYSDASFSYGIGAGLMYKLTRIIPIAGPAIYLDINARYLIGGDTEFQKEVDTIKKQFENDKFNSNQLMYQVDSTPKCNPVGEKDGELAYIVLRQQIIPLLKGEHNGNAVQPTHRRRT